MAAQYPVEVAGLFVPGFTRSAARPRSRWLALRGSVENIVDDLVDIFQAAFGIVGAEEMYAVEPGGVRAIRASALGPRMWMPIWARF